MRCEQRAWFHVGRDVLGRQGAHQSPACWCPDDLIEDHERRSVALLKCSPSRSSAMNVLWPGLIRALMRLAVRSTGRSSRCGHVAADLNTTVRSATWRMHVDLPAMFGPVMSISVSAAIRRRTRCQLLLRTGCLPSTISELALQRRWADNIFAPGTRERPQPVRLARRRPIPECCMRQEPVDLLEKSLKRRLVACALKPGFNSFSSCVT